MRGDELIIILKSTDYSAVSSPPEHDKQASHLFNALRLNPSTLISGKVDIIQKRIFESFIIYLFILYNII